MIEILIVAVLGSLIGLAIGIVPGMGASTVLIASYGILATWESSWVLAFYASVTMSSQFAGSVSALVFGLPGEVTSQPALNERVVLQQNGLIGTAIQHTAMASLVAVFFALGISLLLWNWLPSFVYVLRTESKLLLLLLILLLAAVTGRNTRLVNLLMTLFGLILGMVGVNYQGQLLLTFDQWWLSGGIPIIVLLMGFIAVPSLLNFSTVRFDTHPTHVQPHAMAWSSITRGTVIGCLIGFIPVIGNMITSNLAWLLERSRKSSTALQRISSAEAANNSGNVVVLLPLLMFGLPIVPSEMILYNIISVQGWSHTALTTTILLQIFMAAVISSLIGWATCGILVEHLIKFVQGHYVILIKFAVAIATISVLYLGYQAYNTWFYLLALTACVIIGVILRRRDFTPLLIGSLILSPLLASVQVFYQLYF